MLLIIFLGLIANSALFSSSCNAEPSNLTNFDWTKFSGSWYFLLHESHDYENNLDCPVATVASPEGDTSLVTSNHYHTGAQNHLVHLGNATNWNSTGYIEVTHSVLAIDYDRYFIYKHCHFDTSNLTIYVAYRSKQPDEGTVNDVRRHLQDNNIDVNQMVEFGGNHCPHAESSTEGGSPALNLTLS